MLSSLELLKLINPSDEEIEKTILDSSIFYYINSFFSNKKTVFILTPNLQVAQQHYAKISKLLPNQTLFWPSDSYLTTLSSLATGDFLTTRIMSLMALITGEPYIVIGTYDSILKLQLPRGTLLKSLLTIKLHEKITLSKIEEHLRNFGYQKKYLVEKKGEYSIRGNIMDYYPQIAPNPIRMVVDFDQVELIKEFDLNTQLSINNLNQTTITPLAELYYDDITLTNYRSNLKELVMASTQEKTKLDTDIINLENRLYLDSLTIYLSFLGATNTILDYVDNKLVYFVDLNLYQHNTQTLADEKEIVSKHYHGSFYATLFLTKDYQKIKRDKEINLYYQNDFCSYQMIAPFNNPIDLISLLQKNETYQFIISDDINNTVRNLLTTNDIKYGENLNSKIICIKELHDFNFIAPKEKKVLLSSTFIFKRNKILTTNFSHIISQSTKLASITDLAIDDYIVHYDYGIGQYKGITTLTVSNIKRDYLRLLYRDKESLYIPVDDIHLILKYHYQYDKKIELSKLGSKAWTTLKKKTKAKIKELYDELTTIYQNRNKQEGFCFKPYPELEDELAHSFVYQETPDQAQAISDTLNDMNSNKVMERLICGDVGFGKTEVAIRASYRAVLNQKQVLLLAPTTILARQHYYSFIERLAPLGVNIAMLTRFQTTKEVKKIITQLTDGQIDILIATHKALHQKINYAALGLLIIDEEQRFGVKDKEYLKYKYPSIDTIYLTATPIPRTLEMALSGLKSISVIKTPPVNRYPVQTYLLQQDYLIIREIIERELARGGQVFYLVNEIYLIPTIMKKIQTLLPQLRLGFLHGQMPKETINQVLENYINHEIDLLVTTTIIENGIDIPNVNTIIIDDASRLGLAQLYQIKGRVGRSNKIAYCYMLYHTTLTTLSKKRLETIQSLNELGSGYKIAYEDLLLRGAGNFLGAEQSGFINSLGLEMYLELFKEVIDPSKIKHTQVNNMRIFHHQNIEKSYIAKESLRIEIHKKINKLTSLKELHALENELIDRYGPLESELLLFLHEKLFHYQANLIKVTNINFLNNILELTMPVNSNPYLNVKLLFACQELSKYYIDFKVLKENLIIKINMGADKRNWLFMITKVLEEYFQLFHKSGSFKI